MRIILVFLFSFSLAQENQFDGNIFIALDGNYKEFPMFVIYNRGHVELRVLLSEEGEPSERAYREAEASLRKELNFLNAGYERALEGGYRLNLKGEIQKPEFSEDSNRGNTYGCLLLSTNGNIDGHIIYAWPKKE